MKFKFSFAGLIAGLVGLILSIMAIQQQEYEWLIGSISLLDLGMIMQIDLSKEVEE